MQHGVSISSSNPFYHAPEYAVCHRCDNKFVVRDCCTIVAPTKHRRVIVRQHAHWWERVCPSCKVA